METRPMPEKMAGHERLERCEVEPHQPGSVMCELNELCTVANHYEVLVERTAKILDPLLSPSYPVDDPNKVAIPDTSCSLSAQMRDIKNHIAHLNENLEMLLNRVAL